MTQTRIRSCTPQDRIHPVRPQVALELAVNYAGRDQQRQLPQPGKFVFLGEHGGAIPGRDLARKTFRGRSVDDNDFVRAPVQKSPRDGAGDTFAGNAFHLFAKFFQVLQIDRRDD